MERVLKIVQPILLALWITMAAGGVVNAVDTDSNNGGFVSVFDSKLKRADRYFENFEYKTAIKLYLKLVDKGKINDHIRLRLAESYLKINDPVNAEKWFAEVIHSPEVTAVHQIQYAQTLLSTGKYQQAREVIDQYEFAKSDYRSEAILATLDRLDIFYEDSVNYGINTVEANHQEFSDFSPTVFKEGIVFVSNRSKKGKKFRWDDTPFLDLYYTDSDLASAKPFSNRLNSKYHEGPVAFFDDFNGIIFTRSNYYDGELGSTEAGVNNLQLYTAKWNEKIQDWDQIEAFPLNIEEYSFGHPSLSDDGQRLYFVSDMPGGFGGTDIYLSHKTEMGWSEPVNLGEVINTPGNEMYPQITGDDLFFASNGHGGLGGLDLYQVDISQDQAIVRNMGYPVNTPADDFGISFLPNSDKAFISSNRQGKDNIYQVDILAEDLHQVLANNAINSDLEQNVDNLEPLLATNELSTEQDLELSGTDEDLVTINTSIFDLESQLALEDAQLKVMVDGDVIQTTTADENGNVTLTVPAGKEYSLVASKDEFEDKEITLPAASLGQEEDILIALQPFDSEQLPELSTPQEETLAMNQNQNLDPIAVEGERLEDSGLTTQDKDQLTGVALLDVPEFEDEQTTSEAADSQQELEAIAVEGERLEDSGLTTEDKDQLTGVALLDVPEFEDEQTTSEAADSQQELEAIAVEGERLVDSGLTTEDKDQLSGVALLDAPEFNEEANTLSEDQLQQEFIENSDQNWDKDQQELEAIAVEGERLVDSGLTTEDKDQLTGVALLDAPEFNEEANTLSEDQLQQEFIENSDQNWDKDQQELEAIAVEGERLVDSGLTTEDKDQLSGVALLDVPEFEEETNAPVQDQAQEDQPAWSADQDWDKDQQELESIDVEGERLVDSGLTTEDKDQLTGVALLDVPEFEDEQTTSEAADSQQELEAIAVEGERLVDSGLTTEDKDQLSGVALLDVPEFEDEQTTSEAADSQQELEAIAVEGERLEDSGLTIEDKDQLSGVALLDVPEFEEEANALTENQSQQEFTENSDQGWDKDQQELEAIAVEGERLVDSGLTTEDKDQLTGVALLDVPEFEEETNAPAQDQAQEDQPDWSADQGWDKDQQELEAIAVEGERLEDSGLTTEDKDQLSGVALLDVPEFEEETNALTENQSQQEFTENSDQNWNKDQQELEAIAVEGERLEDSGLTIEDKDQLSGVALLDVPEFEDGANAPVTAQDQAQEDQPDRSTDQDWDKDQQELESIDVEGERLVDSGLTTEDTDQLTGVALLDVPEFEEETNAPVTAQDQAQEDQPDWSADQGWDKDQQELESIDEEGERLVDSGLTIEDKDQLSGVALLDVPEFEDGANAPVTAQDQAQEDQPDRSADQDWDKDQQELESIDVEGERLVDSGLTTEDKDQLTGVALLDVTEFEDGANAPTPDQDQAQEDQPDRSTDQDWDKDQQELESIDEEGERLVDSGLTTEDKDQLTGVALLDVPEFEEETNAPAQDQAQEDQPDWSTDQDWDKDQQELESIDEEGERLVDSGLTTEDKDQLSGVALLDAPEFNEEANTLSEDQSQQEFTENSQQGWDNSQQELDQIDPVDVEGERLVDSGLTTEDKDQLTGVALLDVPGSDGDLHTQQENQAWQANGLVDEAQNNLSNENMTDADVYSSEVEDISVSENNQFVDKQFVDAKVFDAETQALLQDADLKLYVDNPDQPLSYELKDGVLTFEVLPGENYLLVASHDDYQDQFIDITGDDLLKDSQEVISLPLSKMETITDTNNKNASVKFKTVVKDHLNGEIIDGAEVKLFVEGKEVNTESSNAQGKTVIKTIPGENYMALVTREGYQDLIYHIPSSTTEDVEIEFPMMAAQEEIVDPDYQQLLAKGPNSASQIDPDYQGIIYKVFEDGNLIQQTTDLKEVELQPSENVQVIATQEGFKDELVAVEHEGEHFENVEELQPQQVSEASGQSGVYNSEEAIPLETTVFEGDSQLLSDAKVKIFSDGEEQEIAQTWKDGRVTFNAVPGKDYTMLVSKPGYQEQLINIGSIDEESPAQVQVFMQQDSPTPANLASHLDLKDAKIITLLNEQGEEERFVSTDNQVYRYEEKDGNHYLVNKEETIQLKERERLIRSKIKDDQNSGVYNLRSEDQFLYDNLTGDEKQMFDELVSLGAKDEPFTTQPQLNAYYQNLSPEYQGLVNQMIGQRKSIQDTQTSLIEQEVDTPESVEQTALEELITENDMTLSGAFNINNIYYDFDKSDIREDAAQELDKLVALMKSNQSFKLGLLSHTDSRGSNSYNQKLSERRAQAAIDYLIANGIARERLIENAVGETQLANSCGNSISCSEDAHQLNRRTEFRIII